MGKLTSLLGSKTSTMYDAETNLEKGRIYVYNPGTAFGSFAFNFCWCAPCNGLAIIEMWGASGSGALMCCCGGGLPGNAAAYTRKTICVQTGCYICGQPGRACTNASGLCFRGCGDASGLCWFGRDSCGNSNGCMCAQGGRGGVSFCSTGTSMYCCFYANGFCATKTLNENCGTVCNQCTGGWIGCGYGGDVNCCGGISCVSYFGCYPECICLFQQHVAISPGIISNEGAVITFNTENNNEFANWSGQGHYQKMSALNAASRWPSYGAPFASCWGMSGNCGCYENDGCVRNSPVGVPGTGPFPCSGVRDHAHAGGDGAVRIKFIPVS